MVSVEGIVLSQYLQGALLEDHKAAWRSQAERWLAL